MIATEKTNADLIAERDGLVAERQAIRLRKQINALKLDESVVHRPVLEAWGDIVDRSEYLGGDRDFCAGGTSDEIGDRQDGMDRPLFRTSQDLAQSRGMGRFIVNELPGGQAVLNNLANFIVGT